MLQQAAVGNRDHDPACGAETSQLCCARGRACLLLATSYRSVTTASRISGSPGRSTICTSGDPLGVPVFCDTGDGRTIVPGAPYDPVTGRANAVGVIVTSVFNTFTPFGDIRLTEDDGLRCDLAVSAKDFVTLETVEVGIDFRNGSATGQAVEAKVTLRTGAESRMEMRHG